MGATPHFFLPIGVWHLSLECVSMPGSLWDEQWLVALPGKPCVGLPLHPATAHILGGFLVFSFLAFFAGLGSPVLLSPFLSSSLTVSSPSSSPSPLASLLLSCFLSSSSTTLAGSLWRLFFLPFFLGSAVVTGTG